VCPPLLEIHTYVILTRHPPPGSAVYVYLGITGSCLFNLDGRTVGEFIDTIGSDANTMHLAFHNASMPDVPHVLVIYPAEAGLYVQLDRVVYTCVFLPPVPTPNSKS
jgi:hypothetical protein